MAARAVRHVGRLILVVQVVTLLRSLPRLRLSGEAPVDTELVFEVVGNASIERHHSFILSDRPLARLRRQGHAQSSIHLVVVDGRLMLIFGLKIVMVRAAIAIEPPSACRSQSGVDSWHHIHCFAASRRLVSWRSRVPHLVPSLHWRDSLCACVPRSVLANLLRV